MRFIYGYKTKLNETREGTLCAPSRDLVYAELKKMGIRPFKVELAPGVFNRIASFGRRGLAIVVLAVALCVTIVLLLGKSQDEAITSAFDSTTRRQIIGDTAIIEYGIQSGWEDVFEFEGERFLASFAIPGVPAGQRSTSEAEILAALDRTVKPKADDGIEARQIKAMVSGMKSELRSYLEQGGSIVGYGRRLVKRQEAELRYYGNAKSSVEMAKKRGLSKREINEVWERRNSELRRMGIKLLPIPE